MPMNQLTTNARPCRTSAEVIGVFQNYFVISSSQRSPSPPNFFSQLPFIASETPHHAFVVSILPPATHITHFRSASFGTDATTMGSSAPIRSAGSLVCNRSSSRVHTQMPCESSPRQYSPASTRPCGKEHHFHTSCRGDFRTDRRRATLETYSPGKSETSGFKR